MPATVCPHIELDERGRALLTGTNVKVIEIVAEHLAHGWSAEVIHEQHPHLPLAKIYAALGYFYDHEDELTGQLRRQDQEIGALRSQTENRALQDRLRRLKLRGA